MEFEFLPLENLSDELTNLIAELIEPHPEFDKVDVNIWTHNPGSYGFLGIELSNCYPPYTHKESKFIQRVYFSISSN
jgi:hypothetical protein